MRTSRTSLGFAALSLFLSTLVLAAVPSRAGGDDDQRHEIRWVHRGPFQSLGGTFLGIQVIDMTPELRRHFGVPENAGLLVGAIVEDSPAEAAGLLVGDIVTAIDGESVDTHGELVAKLHDHEKGDVVTVEAWRDGRRLELSAELAEQEMPPLLNLGKGVHFLPRIQLEGLDPEDFAHLGENISSYFASPEWKESMEKLEGHRDGLLERLQEMEERLQEMEKRLESIGAQ